MKTLMLCLLLAVPAFAQDSLSTEDLSHRPAVMDERTCTVQDLQDSTQNFTGLQIFDDATLSGFSRSIYGRWEGYIWDDKSDARIEVVCEPELAKRIAADMRTFSKFGRRWHVIVGDDDERGGCCMIKIVELELAKDGRMVRSYN